MNSIERLNNLEDIESGLAAKVSGKPDTTNYSSMESSGSCTTNCCAKSAIWLVIMIISFQIPFCDLYYGYTDDTCVSEPAGRLAINLKD
jgi:hypothetical protein